ncbi:UDP-N-acetylglucosamine 2-epimerase [Lysobacter capsici]|uniref:UDP-N-acetylglucosamine 2-epimerase n=1 Tax=Lysobacter capsici TaxID=435897 RepID=UPI001C0061C2|nr:UDP-N-acetylglucosamine 2-epimerase [Lysobacter capsici]QWF16045.1 UDP-N-acetyl glucosamine 2-epimerase [Lysobacter capsici]
MAPVIKETIRQHVPYSLILTGQHRETFDELQRNFDLPSPDLVLVPEEEVKDRISLLTWAMKAWRRAGSQELRKIWGRSSALVVHGDTASTLLGALIGRRFSLPVAHVEAGLRSFDIFHPFPEELIRIAVSKVSALHLCPDPIAVNNLRGAKGTKLMTEGNTMLDALRIAVGEIADIDATPAQPYAVFSMHRHENLFNRQRLDRALYILRELAEILPVKFVLHPVTHSRLTKLTLLADIERWQGVSLVERMDFVSFGRLIRQSRFVVTDGGSNQEECAVLGIPCVLLRQATERSDGLNEGVLLADLDIDKIRPFAQRALGHPYRAKSLPANSPSQVIVSALREYVTERGPG